MAREQGKKALHDTPASHLQGITRPFALIHFPLIEPSASRTRYHIRLV